MKTDAIIFEELRASGVVSSAASEENPKEVNFEVRDPSSSFSVAFDPLDGSSIIDANFAVGTIVGIWPGQGLVNRIGRDQVCDVYHATLCFHNKTNISVVHSLLNTVLV